MIFINVQEVKPHYKSPLDKSNKHVFQHALSGGPAMSRFVLLGNTFNTIGSALVGPTMIS